MGIAYWILLSQRCGCDCVACNNPETGPNGFLPHLDQPTAGKPVAQYCTISFCILSRVALPRCRRLRPVSRLDAMQVDEDKADHVDRNTHSADLENGSSASNGLINDDTAQWSDPDGAADPNSDPNSGVQNASFLQKASKFLHTAVDTSSVRAEVALLYYCAMTGIHDAVTFTACFIWCDLQASARTS